MIVKLSTRDCALGCSSDVPSFATTQIAYALDLLPLVDAYRKGCEKHGIGFEDSLDVLRGQLEVLREPLPPAVVGAVVGLQDFVRPIWLEKKGKVTIDSLWENLAHSEHSLGSGIPYERYFERAAEGMSVFRLRRPSRSFGE